MDAGDTGIEHGDLMIEFAEAVLGDDDSRLQRARQAIHDALGPDAVVDSSGVCGLFNGIDRIADATGAPLEEDKEKETAALPRRNWHQRILRDQGSDRPRGGEFRRRVKGVDVTR